MRYEHLSSPAIAALDRDATILIVSLGAVEQHGPHLPVGTDSMIVTALCEAAARQRGDTVVLPPPWYGVSPHHMRFPGTVSIGVDTMRALVGDIVDSAVTHGFRRILLVNGHGGNGPTLDVLATTLGHRHHPRVRIAGLTYFQLAAAEIDAIRESAPGGAGHAGEVETSLMLHLAPDLVGMEDAVAVYPDAGSPYLTTDLTGSSPIRTFTDFSDLSSSGVFGDPSLADAGKGERLFTAIVGSLDRFLDDFAGWPLT